MKTLFKRTSVFAAAILIAFFMQGSPAFSEETAPPESGRVSLEVAMILESQAEAHPGGTIIGNQIHYDDGMIITAVEPGVMSLGQCSSGWFCGWAQSNYTGLFYATSGTGVTKSLSWTARSYRNNRSQAARLYNSAGSGSKCFTPGQSRPTIGPKFHAPSKVFLSSSSSC